MSLLKDLLRGMVGGHHGGRRYGGEHHGGNGPNYGGPLSGQPGLACPRCRSDNPASARFCQQCGVSLGPTNCLSCTAEIPLGCEVLSSVREAGVAAAAARGSRVWRKLPAAFGSG